MNKGAWQLQSMELQRVGQNGATNTHPLTAFFMVQLSHPYMTTENNSLDYMDLCWQSDFLLANKCKFAIIAA